MNFPIGVHYSNLDFLLGFLYCLFVVSSKYVDDL